MRKNERETDGKRESKGTNEEVIMQEGGYFICLSLSLSRRSV
jgi:hypothetical protein